MDKRETRLRAVTYMRRRGRRRFQPSQPWWLYSSLGLLVFLIITTPLLFVTVSTVAAAGSALAIYNTYEAEVRDGVNKISAMRERDLFESTRIYDRHGILLYEVVDQGRRTPVPLDDLPKIVIDATVSTEDDTFWDNPGFNPGSVARAVVQNLTGGRILSGFSTITQQLVRHVAFDYEERISQSYERKVKEVVLAWVMTQRMSKREILETYLNEIYYGNLAYGIEAAAKTFFGKSARDLTPPEATFLVGLPAAPLGMDPFTEAGFRRARIRQREVLNIMVQHNDLTQAEADSIYAQGVQLVPEDKRQVSLLAPHFVHYVRQQLDDQFGPDRVNRGGLQVTTTLDLRMQQVAETVAKQQVALLAKQNVSNASLVALKNDTGEILTMLGSVDYWDRTIQGRVNMAVAERQPGSSMKPITYAAALERGITAAEVIWDVKHKEKLTNNQVYEPKNYDEKFHGPVRLRSALANSYNIPAIKLIKRVGVQETIDAAHRLGVTGLNRGPQWYGLSLTLGGGEVSLLGMTTAYSTLARLGYLIPPAAILNVKDGAGNLVYQYTPPTPQLVMNPAAAYIVTDFMSDEAARIPAFGPNSPLKLTQPAAVKTGTTNDYRDNWTLGYTPYMTVGVWVGNADNAAMINSTGVTGAAPIWHDFFEEVFTDGDILNELRPAPNAPLQQTFLRPPGVVEAQICELGPICNKRVRELFVSGTEPREDPAWKSIDVVTIEAGTVKYMCQARPHDIATVKINMLQMPTDPEELKEVREWLKEAKWPMLPPSPCSDEWLALASAGLNPDDKESVDEAIATGQVNPNEIAQRRPTPPPPAQQGGGMPLTTGVLGAITGPNNDSVVTGVTPVTGVVNFNPNEIQFYKIEYRLLGDNWTTIGDVHRTSKTGILETWHAEVLPPGLYQLRLVLVKKDGNFIVPSQVTVRKLS